MEPEITLNTTHPDHITYQTEELTLSILGGIKLESLDRLRVTLKIEVHNRKFKKFLENPEVADLALRHNLDLYNDTQVEKLIRKAAEKLEVGTIALSRAIVDITNQLEEYRLKEHQSKQEVRETKRLLTEEEIQQAREYLSAPGLMERTRTDIGRSGVIGEENNRLLMYLIFTSRKREQPLHLVSLGSSGIGKSHLQEKVGELIPEEDKLEITTLSENAFYYFGQRELKNKLILIEDLDGAEGVLYPLRELQSKKKISKTVTHKDTKGVTRTIHLTVEGPVSVSGCTTRESIYEDNANRSFLIYIDESKEQDERIMQYQRKRSAGNINSEEERQIKELFKNCQRILLPVSIINPYAEALQIPGDVFKPRRTNAHYLAFIEAVTFYHQYQRAKKADQSTGEEYIETTLEDIEEANKLIKEILLRKSDELNKATRNHFEQIKHYLKENNKTAFTTKEVRQALRENHSNQKRYMLELLQNNYIIKSQGTQAKGFTYEVTSYEEYQQLQHRITSILDDILLKLKDPEFTSSDTVQSQNEPPKAKKSSKLNKAVQ